MSVPYPRLPVTAGTATWLWAIALAAAAMALSPAPAHAGVIGETAEEFAKKVTDDPVARKEIGEAVETLIEAAPDVREIAEEGIGAKGGPRQVSGPFQELVVNFDKMACAAWIISFRDTLLGLMLKRDPETPPQTIQAAQNLLNRVVFACRKVLDPDTDYGVAAGGGGGGGQAGGAGGADTATGSTGPGVDVIDGELISSASDWICWNRCSDKWAAWKNAEAMRSRAEERVRRNRGTADALERTQIPEMERELRQAERQLDQLQARKQKDPATNSEITSLTQANQRMGNDIAQMRAEAARLRQEAETLETRLPALRSAEQEALKAYLDCLKACADQARDANAPSTFAERTLQTLTPRLQVNWVRPIRTVPEESAGTRAAMLAAIGALRTGQASMSGTEVSLAVPFGRDPGGQARAEADRAMDRSMSHGYEHGGNHAQTVDPVVPEAEDIPAGAFEQAPAPTTDFVEVQPPAEFYCPDHPGMGPHSH